MSRQALAREALTGLNYVGHPASYFLWLPMPEEVRADQVAMALLRANVCVATAEPFAVSEHVPHAIRLALGSVGPDVLQAALKEVPRVMAALAY